MADKALGLLGLMRKANVIEIGMERSEEAIRKGKAKLVILPENATDRTKKNADYLLRGRNAEQIEVSEKSWDLASSVGAKDTQIITVTDIGFAYAFMKILAGSCPEKYEGTTEKIKKRYDKTLKRKAEKPGKK